MVADAHLNAIPHKSVGENMSCARQFILIVVSLILAIYTENLKSQELVTVIGWNAESGDANPDTVASGIARINGCDIWGMVEVRDSTWAEQFEGAAEDGESANFNYILGTTGNNSRDLMQIIYDSSRFELVQNFELHRINVTGRVRAPLVAHFRIRTSGDEFLFMVNHLYRSREFRRHEQARLLNLWASEQTLPIIAVGDYNFDWDVHVGDNVHDMGYDEMVSHGHFNWIRPRNLKKTQASPRFHSVLDFIFLGGNTWTWRAESRILARDASDIDDNRLRDNNQTSDHRPVMATITIQ